MFSNELNSCIDQSYFRVIKLDDYDIMLQSLNTQHYWCVHFLDSSFDGECMVFHKHHCHDPYHKQAKANNLKQAVWNIKKHDKWQMNGRNR